MKLETQDWLALINAGVTTVSQLLAARAQRKAELAAISPEVVEMPIEQFKAVFGRYYTAEDELAHAAAALVEAGAAGKNAQPADDDSA